MKKILISCGGTGGHLAPGIALAEGLVARGCSCSLLISRKKVDERLVSQYPKFEFIPVSGAPFSLNPAKLASFVRNQMLGVIQAFRIVRRTSPDAAVGFGGFGTLGLALAATVLRVPLVLHEANRVPGRATRFLGRFATRVYLPLGVRLPTVEPGVIRHYPCPVRREIRRLSAKESRENLGFDPRGKLLVVLGGSQGAACLNRWVREHLELLGEEGIHVCCITGMDKGSREEIALKSGSGDSVKARFLPFTDRMAELLSAADLVVTRAGAGAIHELIRCRVPSILVPYPYAADNHQWANARFVERQGGGIVVGEDYLETLHREVVDTIFNDWLLRKFRANLERMDREDALERILDDIENISGSRASGHVPKSGRREVVSEKLVGEKGVRS